jgi:hypothetical protein
MTADRKKGRNFRILAGACVAGGFAMAFPAASNAAPLPNIVLSDNLASTSSTLNSSTNSPNATSTNYDIAANKGATSAFSSAMKLNLPASTSAGAEAQALFTTSPIALTNVGTDEIELTVTFTAANNILSSSTSSTASLDLGLYNSGGTAPDNNLQSSGLTTAATNDATGGAQGWLGYVGAIYTTSAPKIFTRPAQPGTSNVGQDLVLEGQSYGYAGGVQLAGGSATVLAAPLTNSSTSQYTEDLLISLSAASTYTVSEELYSGTSDTGTPIAGFTGASATGTSFLTSSFDGLAVGWRFAGTSAASEMDIDSITVSTTVPEPATLGTLTMVGLGLLHRRRRKA